MKKQPQIQARQHVFDKKMVSDCAEKCWWRKTSKRKLAEEFNLTPAQVKELLATPAYQKCVETLMLRQRTSEEFEKWVKDYEKRYKNMPEEFGARMHLGSKMIPAMVKRVRDAHSRIAEGADVPKMILNPRKTYSWNEMVKIRDSKVCRKCKRRYNLHAHHILPKAEYPNLETEVSNGITLCGNCHSLLKGKETSIDIRDFLRDDPKIDCQLEELREVKDK